jgi:RNA polymerase sigma factor (sigma-70 family)
MPPHARALLGHLHRLTSPTPADAALLEGWMRQRDESAFAALVARHGPMVLGVARRVLGDVQHAEDVFQATFLVLARHADKLRRPESLPGYLHGVALRLAKKSRGAARHRLPPISLENCEPVSAQPHPLDVLSGRDLLALIDEEVSRLPEVYRLPVLLCVVQGRPVEEAARMLGWGVGSVRGRLARGRERLRQRLARRGLALSVGAVGLLAPAALPERLLAQVVRNLSDAPSAIDVLASTATAPLRRRLIGLGVLLAVIGLGVGLPLLRAPAEPQPPADKPAEPERAKEEPRRDRHGDLLPPGAVARLGTLRFRVQDEVGSVALSPDGKTLAVSSGRTLFFLDAASGKRINRHVMDSNGHPEDRLAFSPDGKRLVSRGAIQDGKRYKGVVRVSQWAGEAKPTAHDAEHAVWVGWSPAGEPLAVCLESDGLRLQELGTGRSQRFACKDLRKPELSRYVYCACAPAGNVLAVADEQGTVHLWDTDTGRERPTVQPRGNSLFSLALTSDGRTLATLTRESIQLWDATTGKEALTLATDQKYLTAITFSPDGKTLATLGGGEVRFWDVTTGRERGRTKEWYDFVPSLAFSSDGKTLLTAERHGATVHLWDVATGKEHSQPSGHRSRPHGTAFAPDGRRVATGGGLDGSIHVWDLTTGESLTRIQRRQWVRNIAFSRDGSSLFSTWIDENLWISNANTGELQHVLKLEDPDRPDTRQSAISLYQSADGKTLVAFSYYYPKDNQGGPQYQDTLITGWDAATRKQLFRRRRPGQDSWLALSADARVLAAPHPGDSPETKRATGMGPMQLEDVATGELLRTFPTLDGQTWPLTFSPDGRWLASNNSDWKRKGKEGDPASATGYSLRLWETATASEVLALPADPNNRAAFSPEGRLLALAAPGPAILVWDLARGREWQRFKGFDTAVTYLAFTPDGRRLLSGLSDSTFLVWDVGTPEPPGKLGAEDAAKAWADLAGADGPRALRAHWALAGAPEEALSLLQKHLRPARAADARQVQRLLAELDSDQFEVREKAQAALAELGDLAEPALREVLKKKPALDVHRRVQSVLDGLRKPVTQPESLRTLRGVGVLETVGTAPARQLLQELAAGAAEARLTREARAALTRHGQKSPPER